MNLIEVLQYLRGILDTTNLVIRAHDANAHVHAVAFLDSLMNQETARVNAVLDAQDLNKFEGVISEVVKADEV